MKKVIGILSVIILFCACKKQDKPILNLPIVGSWKWAETYKDGPLTMNNPLTPQNTGIQMELSFYNDGTWHKVENNVVVGAGTFTVGHAITTLGEYDSIKYKTYTGSSVQYSVDYYFIVNDTLYFNSGFAGIYGGDYQIWGK
jgi:hypothetical protein